MIVSNHPSLLDPIVYLRVLPVSLRVLAYPEGRISPDGTIGEFKDGAFIIALTAHVPVVPVAIHGTSRIWPPGRRAIRAGQVRVVAGHPLPTGGLSHRDVDRLRDQARDVICAAIVT
jgi:1-acyl-sn-glycerol-3-phosphate acyltransferase